MKPILLLIIISLFATLNLNAQGPGYQGKHFFLRAEITPRVIWEPELNAERGVRRFAHVRAAFGADYVFSRMGVVGLTYEPPVSRYFPIVPEIYSSIIRVGEVSDFSIGLSYKNFFYHRSGFYAPNGRYFELRPFLTFFRISDLGETATDEIIELEDLSYKALGLSIYVGDQAVAFNRLLPNIVFGISVMKTNYAEKILNENTIGRNGYQTYNAIYGRTDLNGFSFRAEIKIGLGALLF